MYTATSPPYSVRPSGPPQPPTFLSLNEATLKSFRISRTFQENSAPINHMDFSPAGDTLLTSADDESIVIYDCMKGSVSRIINCKKYGVENIIYTHSSTAALHSSSKADDHIRYLNLQENKYISSFTGHTKKIAHICLSPVDDQFISSAADKSVRLWDHRLGCVGVLPNLEATPIIAFDPEGLVFAVGCCVEREQRIMLYDLRGFHEGPFAVFRYGEEQEADWCGMKISPNGRYLLVSTNGSTVYVMDSFTGDCLFTLKGHVNRGLALEASFTPDSNYVSVASYNGQVHIWSLKSGLQIAVLPASKQKPTPPAPPAPLTPSAPPAPPAPLTRVKFSPTTALIATAGSQVSFWLPSLEQLSHSR